MWAARDAAQAASKDEDGAKDKKQDKEPDKEPDKEQNKEQDKEQDNEQDNEQDKEQDTEQDKEQVVALMRSDGLNATVSSIHINGWIGDHDKLAGARWIVREHLGRDLDAEREHWVYVGDSTNDAVMFGHFPHSVGVANVARFWDRLTHRPRYVTAGERGAGFSEVVRAVLSVRRIGA